MAETSSRFMSMDLLTISFLAFSLYVVIGATYRLCWSPLAKFPGRKLAALTLWYEFYHDYFRRGQYTWEIADMHAQYGPIVRISPHELHIDYPDYYDYLYGSTLKLDKYPWIVKQFGNQLSTMGTASHDLHKLRRNALAPFLSPARVIQLEGLIRSKIEKLCNLIKWHRLSKTAINLHAAYRAMTMDVISEYAMTESFDYLGKPDLGKDWYRMLRNGSEAGYLLRQFPWFLPVVKSLPYKFVIWLIPDAAATLGLHRTNELQVKAIKEAGPDKLYEKDHPTIFYELLFNSNLPPHEKTIDRMAAEGTLLIVAGSESLGNALTTLHFRLLANPQKLARLKEELIQAIPNPDIIPRWQDLRKLPYLTACIDENLRITNPGAVHRLARIAPQQGLKFQDWNIPPGAPVSMNMLNVHMNASIFPQPNDFLPERWLSPAAKTGNLKRYLVPFAKGPRQCLGLELAYAEMYLAAATVHRRFATALHRTSRADVDVAHDFFNPYPRQGSRGVRVTVE